MKMGLLYLRNKYSKKLLKKKHQNLKKETIFRFIPVTHHKRPEFLIILTSLSWKSVSDILQKLHISICIPSTIWVQRCLLFEADNLNKYKLKFKYGHDLPYHNNGLKT